MSKQLSLLVLVASLFLGACVSSTSGPPKPEPDSEDAAEFNYQLGARYYRNGKYELARDRLKLSLDFDAKRAITWSTLALTYEALQNPRLARDAYEQAVKVQPKSYDAQNAYAVYLCRVGEFDKAAKLFERAAEIVENDNSEITLTNAGVCMVQQPNFAKAEEFFREALARKTNYPEALLQMCSLKYKSGDFMSARAFLQRYLSGNGATAGLLYLGYQIEDKLGDRKAREEFATRLIREFPASAEARTVLQSG